MSQNIASSDTIILSLPYLQSVVGEAVEVRRGEEVQGVFRRHHDVTIVNVAQQAVKGLPRGYHLSYSNL